MNKTGRISLALKDYTYSAGWPNRGASRNPYTAARQDRQIEVGKEWCNRDSNQGLRLSSRSRLFVLRISN